jgi:hypothetical protein
VFFPGFAPGRKLNPQGMQQNAVERGDFAMAD